MEKNSEYAGLEKLKMEYENLFSFLSAYFGTIDSLSNQFTKLSQKVSQKSCSITLQWTFCRNVFRNVFLKKTKPNLHYLTKTLFRSESACNFCFVHEAKLWYLSRTSVIPNC